MSQHHKALVAYVPCPHAGYVRMFRKHRDAQLYVLGEELIKDFKSLVRNLPALHPGEVRKMINGVEIFYTEEYGHCKARILDPQSLEDARGSRTIVMPDEDVSHAVAKKYFADRDVTFEDWRLRWDWGATVHKRRPEVETVVSHAEFDRALMVHAIGAADKSPDWWRQIGALLVRDGKVVLVGFNTHLPSEQSAYLMGDPRSNFEAGQHIDASLALHAEAGIIATAANRGISTHGCDLYVTTFPCPPCAASVAVCGIRRLYYVDGYSLVAGADTLQALGCDIIRVDMQPAPAPV